MELTLSNLRFERDDLPLFSGMNAQFKAGSVVQIAGPNGVGKTTLLKIIAGLLTPTDGEVLWCGVPASGYEFRSSMLYLGHHPGIKVSLTPMENLSWYFGINGVVKSDDPSLFPRALETVGLRGYEDIPCQQMSAGQQRRAALARLYCTAVPVWILDEPFTAIDVQGVKNLEELIGHHTQEGGIVLMTSHQPISIDGLSILNVADFLAGDEVGEEVYVG
ncbi:cytochrome c biogenesis heme-transporting ATPase CcmA [Teredinibacter sp. KSP-S5-2]|uniref:cytochrome c biogenesis heme-transporting ATPase CcmA n=1 Tax=Teredinibacter sp. KSP-S5-2 TaxID=3034506 RepID=UPI00293462B4|nr:cytochrome c biogenesis heme-transporting ATPase CcmA [Teredinibacter sp. KSP-S5-2]WNO07708.1 cytochrome c biogenesis heme-transporting ATPase CcmA [Teredinibacter sp. KSP-S5-2]